MSFSDAQIVELTTITPVTIGTDKNKQLAEGMDFVYDRQQQRILVLNADALLACFSKEEMAQYSLAIMAQNHQQLQRLAQKYAGRPGVTRQVYASALYSDDHTLNPIIRTGTGIPYVPGSSLKGALRSAILGTRLDTKRIGHGDRSNDVQGQVFGSIAEDWMSYLSVGDCHFAQQHLRVLHAKTANLMGNNTLGWKHRLQGNTDANFKTNGFVFAFECLAPGSSGKLKVRVNSSDLKSSYEERLKKQRNYRPDLAPHALAVLGEGLPGLLKLVNAHTLKHLQREIAWLQKFEADDALLDCYRELLAQAQDQPAGSAILRVGFGVGYHSITGDWKYPDHNLSLKDKHQSGKHAGKAFAKSRKVLFEKSRAGSDFVFWPMGFVRLQISADTYLAAPNTAEAALGAVTATAAASGSSSPPAAPPVPAEPPKIVPYAGKLKVGVRLDATFLREKVKEKTMLLHLMDGNYEAPMSYPTALDSQAIYIVEIKELDKKGRITRVGFVKEKK